MGSTTGPSFPSAHQPGTNKNPYTKIQKFLWDILSLVISATPSHFIPNSSGVIEARTTQHQELFLNSRFHKQGLFVFLSLFVGQIKMSNGTVNCPLTSTHKWDTFLTSSCQN